jgi:hypothetical protein
MSWRAGSASTTFPHYRDRRLYRAREHERHQGWLRSEQVLRHPDVQHDYVGIRGLYMMTYVV